MKKFEVVKSRATYVKSCRHDIQFAKDQIRFWTKYQKDCEKYLTQAQASLKEAQGWDPKRNRSRHERNMK